MNKVSIKIIKRKDAVAVASVKAQRSGKAKSKLMKMSGEKIERRLHRKMANTVSNWIAERRENRRNEEVSAFRKLFGDEFLSGRLA